MLILIACLLLSGSNFKLRNICSAIVPRRTSPRKDANICRGEQKHRVHVFYRVFLRIMGAIPKSFKYSIMTQNDLRRMRMFHRSLSVSEGSATTPVAKCASYVMVWPRLFRTGYPVCSYNMGVACISIYCTVQYMYMYRTRTASKSTVGPCLICSHPFGPEEPPKMKEEIKE